MSTAERQLLAAFDARPTAEQSAVMAELLNRHPIGAGDLPDAAFVELAEELFLAYDADEAV